ncbi:MAG: 1-aminocyclopropane-1-carboxylate deaminase/D-cysteine desulfhydrase [Sulfurovum sp.]|nr:1-aminocyclopropane-1-carboxylate deaminase/D-cysteine desulfhydrase [Sulfurovum sp.]MCB4754373.1 1-aminocyclopropane-1-carboxylate deaminase/D-cysteine desulfhydrase [Sulfurovum sp.]MCB4776389.1 1-aminocyclopropane-1-carboxylate deaminase/D-cysteine desulfhydrase [Sulfurovum sp.]
MQFPSPIQATQFENYTFYLKRDDLIDIDFSGNKARKFYYFLTHDFPSIKKVISRGSVQSNAMYSLSVLAKRKRWEFEYYVDHLPDYLKQNPHGNYKAAIENGMKIYVGVSPSDYPQDILFIEEGGRQKEAEYGIRFLAKEIIDWQIEKEIPELTVFLPSGTGTTALFLQKHLLDSIQSKGTSSVVYTSPCVGDTAYLKEQFSILEANQALHPTIISLPKKYHFGKLYRENYEIWLKLQQQTGVVYDLLYDPLGWRSLLAHPVLYEKKPLLYIHQGGILGNESMIRRYERKYPELSL